MLVKVVGFSVILFPSLQESISVDITHMIDNLIKGGIVPSVLI